MVAVYKQELLSWYLITLKLRETVETSIPRNPNNDGLIELPQRPKQEQQLQNEQQNPSDAGLNGIREANGIQIAEETTSPPRVKEWVISIKEKLEEAREDDVAGSWAKLTIYRIPHYLQENDSKAYIPQIVSLGPYHHGKKRLRAMDRHKWRALNRILTRTNQDIKVYLDSMEELEEKVRVCYEGNISLSSNEFVEMLVLDGCFMLEIFRGAYEGFGQLGYPRNDPVFAMRGSMHSIQRDMIMLENQIPLFALDRLMGIQIGDPNQRGLVAKLATSFLDPLMPTDEPLTESNLAKLKSSLKITNTVFDPLSDMGDFHHCLDVFRRSVLRSGLKPVPKIRIRKRSHRVVDKRRQQLIHCVTELREAGIKCRKHKTDRFWDIQFSNGVLKIPRILIHDGTKSLFLNLISFEQCHLDCSNDITSYVIFMDNLINSPEDVSYLHYRGILEHWLGSDDEVADLFNRLCQEVVFDVNDSYLSRLSEDVNRYYNQRWNAWRATLKHKYFNNPWAVISVFAAVILLFLTSAQTFYAVYAYYWPRS